MPTSPDLPWLGPDDGFPDPATAWGPHSAAPGLLAAGGALNASSLLQAYQRGIFPWFSEGQPVLWWSPDPRMVLRPSAFRLHRSLRKTLSAFRRDTACEVRMDSDFSGVIRACAATRRQGQSGTWIGPDMVAAYESLHAVGIAHSIETWIHGELAGGLYCVAVGHAVFGESMFTRRPDASKIALAALVSFCRAQGVPLIDCQQNTRHLASLGATEEPRMAFLQQVQEAAAAPSLAWVFSSLYWNELLSPVPYSP